MRFGKKIGKKIGKKVEKKVVKKVEERPEKRSSRREFSSREGTTCGRNTRRSGLGSPVPSGIRRSARYLPGRSHVEPTGEIARGLPTPTDHRARVLLGDSAVIDGEPPRTDK
jgi:hypothetical protein